ncbi:MAG: hypothetical protein DRI70_04915, partial [Bacteroidetes bacterium]
MKKIIFLFLVFLFSYSYSQSFLPMLEEDNIWSVDVYFDPFVKPPVEYTITHQMNVSGAITMNGKIYKRVYNNDGETSCLVREENGIVYQIDENNSTEIIKYDFTLEVGNVFDFSNFFYCSYAGSNNGIIGELEVINVDTQFIAGEDRKVIEFEQGGAFVSEIWMEGIGSIRGFDPFGQMWDISNDGTLLVCFTKNGTVYFFNGATSCDNTTLSLDDLDRDQIILYPNPVSSTSILQFPSEGIVDLLKIYNVTGKLVKEEKVDKDYVLIDSMQYRSGLYFYQVFSGKKLIKTRKFVIK